MRGIKKFEVFTAQALAAESDPGDEVTSEAQSGIAGGQNMSLYLAVTGAGGDVKVEILLGLTAAGDFEVPQTGGTILASVADELLKIKAISVPVGVFFKLRISSNVGGAAVVVDATVLSQQE